MNKPLTWAIAALAAVILVVGIVLAVVVSNLASANKEADYRACMADRGGTTVEELARNADVCYSAVYGD